MNKTAIKNFAIWARVQLIESAKQRAYEYEITETGNNKANVDSIGGRLLSVEEKEQRKQLISQIQRKGYTQVMEEAAYTWFNRFIALRYMEVNGFLPSKVRVFTDKNGAFKPEILKEAMTVEIDGLDRARVLNLLDKQDNEALYKYLLITQCNALNAGLPYMFEKIANWSELLFPANLLRSDSIIGRMVNEIPEEDWQDAVQIIGWMYQFYNIEPKAKVFSKTGGAKITKEEIPAATQLFTPAWIVKYMVENSLGKLWIEGHPDENLKANWKYYLDEAEQEPAVEAELQKIRTEYANIKPEDIKIIDPCMGSGHILVYAFDVLMQIYIAAGYSERDAAKSILENNIYGFEIDDRAGQLAYFAVMMKARKYSRRILNSGITPNVFSIQDSSFMNDDFITFVANKDHDLELDLIGIRNAFVDAKEYGSVLSVPKFDYEKLYTRIEELKTYFPQTIFESEYRLTAIEKLYQIVKQAEMLHQKYDVTVTNPPYMAVSAAGPKLNSYVVKNFPDSKTDMFAVFIERCGQMLKKNGFQAMITMHSWMFLPSYEELRVKLLTQNLINLAHLGTRAFEEISGEVVQTVSFVYRKASLKEYKSAYVRLVDYPSEKEKAEQFGNGANYFVKSTDLFMKMPSEIYAYWVSENTLRAFTEYGTVSDFGDARQGMATGNNEKFVRFWYEIEFNEIGFGSKSYDDFCSQNKKYVPYTKSAGLCRWYGNYLNVLKFDTANYELLSRSGNCLPSRQYYFQSNSNWSLISTGRFGARYAPEGNVFDVGAHAFYSGKNAIKMLGYLNTNVFEHFIKFLSPTINYNSGIVAKVPALEIPNAVEDVASDNIKIAKTTWDAFELSWDFKKHPLV